MTNKTKLSAAALFSALVLGGTFATGTVFAAQAGPDPVNGGSVSETGHAYVTFTKDGSNPVVDPGNPNESLPSDTPGVTGETGELTLDAIPLSLNFGTNEATGAGQVVNLLASNGTSATPADNRDLSAGKDDDGTATTDRQGASGNQVIFTQVTNVSTAKPTWTLSANMTDFTNKAGETLPGAFITFGGGTNYLDKYDTTAAKATHVWEPQTTTDEANPNPNALTQDVQLAAGGSATFLSTSATGTYQQQWDDSKVTLTTPEAPTKGAYTSTINWTLTAAPAGTTQP